MDMNDIVRNMAHYALELKDGNLEVGLLMFDGNPNYPNNLEAHGPYPIWDVMDAVVDSSLQVNDRFVFDEEFCAGAAIVFLDGSDWSVSPNEGKTRGR